MPGEAVAAGAVAEAEEEGVVGAEPPLRLPELLLPQLPDQHQPQFPEPLQLPDLLQPLLQDQPQPPDLPQLLPPDQLSSAVWLPESAGQQTRRSIESPLLSAKWLLR